MKISNENLDKMKELIKELYDLNFEIVQEAAKEKIKNSYFEDIHKMSLKIEDRINELGIKIDEYYIKSRAIKAEKQEQEQEEGEKQDENI